MSKISKQNLLVWSVGALIVLLPSNLFLKLDLSHAYVHGLLVDYLIPKIFLTDLVVVVVLVLGLLNGWQPWTRWQKMGKWGVGFFVLLALLFARQFLTLNPETSLGFLAKFIEMFLLGDCLWSLRSLLPKPLLTKAVATMIAAQSIIAILQFWTQRSVFPSYAWFGEVRFAQVVGLTQGEFWGRQLTLPYGSTAHPNILAGLLIAGIFWLLWNWKSIEKKWQPVFGVIIALAAVPLLLTQSLTGLTMLVTGAIVLTYKNHWFFSRWVIGFSLILFLIGPMFLQLTAQTWPEDLSLTRRNILNQTAWNMWKSQPIFGVGLNHFTVEQETYQPKGEIIRFVQPAHHIGLLWLSETGILGMILVAVLFRRIFQNDRNVYLPVLLTALFFVPAATFDHYLLTNQTGLLLVVMSILFFTKESNYVPPRRNSSISKNVV